MKLKVCGMKSRANIVETASLRPDFMGFIFWDKSPRHFDSELPEIDRSIKKVGVFVDASEDEIVRKVDQYKLDLVQLHGSEPAEFCSQLASINVGIIKAFRIDGDFDFKILEAYEPVCDYFLFDAKGENPGGNGTTFDWNLLEKYTGTTPIFLGGGISRSSIEAIKNLKRPVFAIDINSKFEIGPGLKNVSEIRQFKSEIK